MEAEACRRSRTCAAASARSILPPAPATSRSPLRSAARRPSVSTSRIACWKSPASPRRWAAVTGRDFITGDMTSLPFASGLIRSGDDRLWAAQRSRSRRRDRRNCARVEAGRAIVVARFQSSRRTRLSAPRISAISPSSDRRSAGFCIAIPTPIATSPLRFGATPARAALPIDSRARGFDRVTVIPLLFGLMSLHLATLSNGGASRYDFDDRDNGPVANGR